MSLLLLPRSAPITGAGVPYGGARLYVYRAGTLTDLPVYTTSSFGVAHPQPVQADSNGLLPAIYVDPSLGFDVRVILKTSADVVIYDEDNIPRSSNVLGATTVTGTLLVSDRATSDGITSTDTVVISEPHPRLYLNETDAAAGKRTWCLEVDGAVLTLSTVTDGLAAGSNILKVTRGVGTAVTSIEIGGLLYYESGSFTPIFTGVSSGSGSITYTKVGDKVTLVAPSGAGGASTSTAFSFAGLPTSLRPVNAQKLICANIVDNDIADYLGQVSITAGSDTVTISMFSPGTLRATQAFNSSGTKGIGSGWTITYSVN